MSVRSRLKAIRYAYPVLLLICLIMILPGCSLLSQKKDAPFNGKDYIRESELTATGEDIEAALSSYERIANYDNVLSVPTYVTKVGDYYFIVDSYHNRVIYSYDLSAPLNEWYIMCSEATQPHTMASDGEVYLIEDTENNRVLVYELINGCFLNTQVIYKIGDRPHFTYYDEKSDTFYVWSSNTGELYCFRHTPDSTRLYLTDVRTIDKLSGLYVRSFSIIDGDIYFVSGTSADAPQGEILVCDLDTLKVKKSYPVPGQLAGMVQITKIDKMFYITVSTDIYGNQDYADLVRTSSLDNLASGQYESIYEEYFIGGGTPYNISRIEDTYYLTEHRLQGHSIWSFQVEKNGLIRNVKTLF